MGEVFVGFAIVAFAIVTGYIVARTGVAGAGAEGVLNRIAFFVTMPALLFTVLATADLQVIFSSFLAVAFISTVGVSGLFVVLSRLFFRLPMRETTIGAMASGYVNANNMGLPISLYVLGDASYVAPIISLQLLVLAPVVLTILDVSSSGHATLRSIFSQPVRNPMIIASVLGLIVSLTGITLPDLIFEPLVLLGGAAVPLVLMAFGMSLHGSRPLRAGTGRRSILVASALKSVGMPLLAYLCARFLFNLGDKTLLAAVLLAALPSGQSTYNFASRYEHGVVLSRDVVLITTAMSAPILVIVTALLT